MRPLLLRLRRDRQGVTIVEFALIAPVVLAVILGLCELTYQSYIQSVLTGAMQAAGRNSTVQGNESEKAGKAIDAFVISRVQAAARKVTWTSSRKSYAQFGNIAPEPFQDNNKNNVYDKATECFTDINNNKTWDADPGISGQGGANDVVVYRMDVTYNRLLPVTRLMGLSPTMSISSTTILRNQPWRAQAVSVPTQVCP